MQLQTSCGLPGFWLGLVAISIAGTPRDVSQGFPSSCLASLDQVRNWRPGPPAFFLHSQALGDRVLHTHTHHTHTHRHTHTHTHLNDPPRMTEVRHELARIPTLELNFSHGSLLYFFFITSSVILGYLQVGVFGLAPRHCTCRNTGRYTDWRPNLLHGVSTAVFVGSRTVDSLLPPAFSFALFLVTTPLVTGCHTHSCPL